MSRLPMCSHVCTGHRCQMLAAAQKELKRPLLEAQNLSHLLCTHTCTSCNCTSLQARHNVSSYSTHRTSLSLLHTRILCCTLTTLPCLHAAADDRLLV